MTVARNPGRESLVESISRDLRDQILAGKLAPGRRISQLSIADHYGVSRLPVREALRSLSSQGLVEIEPGRGARVTALDAADLSEVYLMRERLEPMAVALAVERVSEVEIKAADSILAQMEAPRTSENEWLQLDREFHTMWYRHVQMPRLAQTIDQLWDVAQRYRAMFRGTPGAISMSQLEHRMMLESIRRRSAKDAEALLEVHLRHVRLTLETSVTREGTGRHHAPRVRARAAPDMPGRDVQAEIDGQPPLVSTDFTDGWRVDERVGESDGFRHDLTLPGS